MKKVCVLGLGYIGLPTASLLATKGFEVLGVDVDTRRIEALRHGEAATVEPDLDVLVKSAVLSGRLQVSVEPGPADVFILAVPTPVTAGNRPDLSYVEKASDAVAPHLEPGNLVVLESTCPVGTTQEVADRLARLRRDLTGPDRRIYVAHCPERVLPGRILQELISNDRVVGGVDEASGERALQFYSSFVVGRIRVTDAATAELSKLAENTSRDVAIAFANELAAIAGRLGIDVWEVIEIANRHPRVRILEPGPGVGGHCIAVDPWLLIAGAGDGGALLRAAREVNDARPGEVAGKVRAAAAGLGRPVIACLGLSYKSDVDDLRGSPAVEIVERLAGDGYEVLAVEPHIRELPPRLASLGVRLASLETAVASAQVVVALVRHRPFRTIPPESLADKVVVDVCGMWRRGSP